MSPNEGWFAVILFASILICIHIIFWEENDRD